VRGGGVGYQKKSKRRGELEGGVAAESEGEQSKVRDSVLS